jgi:hypothetical protein
MEPSRQPTPGSPYDLRPEERWYAVGWLLFVVAGVYFINRGIAEERSPWIFAGSVAILLGVSQAAVIAIRQLRPWRKIVRVACMVIILAALVVIFALDFMGRPLLR